MKKSETDNWLERVWEYREEVIYPKLFGKAERGIFTLTTDFFTEYFKQDTIDPRWLHYGVLEYSPTTQRPSWLYVTSGMSNAWEDSEPQPAGPSGFGMKFVLEAPVQNEWAIFRLLHVMAFQILLVHQRYKRKEPIGEYDRIPLQTSITSSPSSINWMIVAPPNSYPTRFQLESGWVDLLTLVGITEEEAEYARNNDGSDLIALLEEHDAFPVTNPGRRSVI